MSRRWMRARRRRKRRKRRMRIKGQRMKLDYLVVFGPSWVYHFVPLWVFLHLAGIIIFGYFGYFWTVLDLLF